MIPASFGELNSHAISILMKELVWRAIRAIRAQRFKFSTEEKSSPAKEQDYVTSADRAAQERYIKSLRECCPFFGIIAEEDAYKIPCTHPTLNIHCSVDGLDGTKAWVKGQSHGIGTMLALYLDGEIVSAWIGDVMTQELYGFRPGSLKAHRIDELGQGHQLRIDLDLPLAKQSVVLRDHPDNYSPTLLRMTRRSKDGGLFKDIEVSGGSIGIGVARLWKGEVGGILMKPTYDAPWDVWPLIGICKQMGFVWLRPSIEDDRLKVYEPPVTLATLKREHPVLIIHQSRLEELEKWQQKQ